ncbi:MAG: DUF4373 domain-containing protein [Desulfobulbaceae bacterium]|nr:DUF4373 domain-containing protein [Desulfobulbaceae bacterium]
MKWFKHMSHSHIDEKLASIISENGLEGYGFWWMLMEVVAAQCVDEKCSATYTLPHWSRLLCCHHHKVVKYMVALAGLPKGYSLVTPPVTHGLQGIVTVEYVEGKIRVTIPNLLKYRDEYSKKSRQRPDSVLSKKEKEKEKENIIPSSSVDEVVFYLTKKKRKLYGKRLETFNLFWDAFDYKKGRAEAADSWIDIPSLTVTIVDKIIDAAKIEAVSRKELIASGKTPIMAQGWISGRRWEDETNNSAKMQSAPLISDAHRKAFERLSA